MRKFSLATIAVWTAFAACSTPSSQQNQEITSRSEAWGAAFNSGDIDAVEALYSEDCRVLPPNGELGQGREAARAVFSEMIEAGQKAELETIESISAGDLGYHVGTYTLQSADGKVIDHGKFVETWRQVDGQWQISNDIWNSDLPATPQETTLMITAAVKDVQHFLAAWQGEQSRHQLFAQHGAPRVRVFQSPGKGNRMALLVGVEDMKAFQAFLDSPESTAAKAEDGVRNSTLHVYSEVH
ncbi:MAG: YybH family protein [Acidobacteriota bacterium]